MVKSRQISLSRVEWCRVKSTPQRVFILKVIKETLPSKREHIKPHYTDVLHSKRGVNAAKAHTAVTAPLLLGPGRLRLGAGQDTSCCGERVQRRVPFTDSRPVHPAVTLVGLRPRELGFHSAKLLVSGNSSANAKDGLGWIFPDYRVPKEKAISRLC